jgi:solute carrier family 9B (sodium/hydrogen exchanger), member 1/2
MIETHDDVMLGKNLPRVGQTVRSKKHGTLWRVVEKREMWVHTEDDPETGDPRMLPAIYLCYWEVREGQPAGIGKMLGYAYTLHDTTFETNWEIAKDK